ncbi:MAG: hypothetical protein IJ145_07900 [Prevotella sp.]|nr:hypothetical protein [Prevotella sp.]
MKNKHITFITCISFILLTVGCDYLRKRDGICGENALTEFSVMSKEEKQAFLEEKFKELIFPYEIELIPTATEKYLYCWVENKDSNVYEPIKLLQFDLQKDKWTTLFPMEESEDKLYYSSICEYRMKGNRLYCQFSTGQCGLGLESYAFEYLDIQEGKWHFITYGTEESELVGDSIKAIIGRITKQGLNAFDTEVELSTKWIKLE